MFQLGLKELKNKKIHLIGIFFFVLTMYTIIDSLNMSYNQMAQDFGYGLVFANVFLNFIMSVLTSVMLTLSIINMELKGKETKSSNFGFLSFLFGIMTYGCTSCVITFLANIGITYSVIALPLAGLPYKFMSLAIIILGLFFTRYEMNKPCSIK